MRWRSWGVVCAVVVAWAGVSGEARAADVTGTWTWNMSAPAGTIQVTFKLKQDGDKVTGTVTGPQETAEIRDGKVTGEEVSFRVTSEFNGNRFVRTYRGRVSGKTIRGTMRFERNGQASDMEWEAKKAP